MAPDNSDPQAAFGLHWSTVPTVDTTEHLGRHIETRRHRDPAAASPDGIALCVVTRGQTLEGMVTLRRVDERRKATGTFLGPGGKGYRLAVDPFEGDWPELVALTKRVLDSDYVATEGLGLTKDGVDLPPDLAGPWKSEPR